MSLGEFDIIRKFFAEPGLSFPREGVVLSSGDDAAVLQAPAGKSVVVTTDVLTVDRHFPANADPAAIAWRSLAVNLSDLAAMAAEPWCFTLGLTLPEADETWLAAFGNGLKQLAQQYNCPLVGGDLNYGPLNIAIQAQGLLQGEPLLRSGAEAGDTVYVSGSLGDAAIALLSLGVQSHLGDDFQLSGGALPGEQAACLANRYFYPQPRVQLAMELRPVIKACIDISDGLAGDLGHILEASGVGAILRQDKLPLSTAARAAVSEKNCYRAALFGGDDYELCFTAGPSQQDQILQLAQSAGVAVTAIGEITASAGLRLVGPDGDEKELNGQSFRHFQS